MGVLNRRQKGFNKRLSGLRIKVEHIIGTLKALFAILRYLPHHNIFLRINIIGVLLGLEPVLFCIICVLLMTIGKFRKMNI